MIARDLPEQFNIAIDGPAASGKSTVGELVANRLDAICFDTGLLYRAVAWAVGERGVSVDDVEAVTAIAKRLDFGIQQKVLEDHRTLKITVNGQDVTLALHTLGADSGLSKVSAYSGVRSALLELQREIASSNRVIVLGRDIGTVVLPDADVKIYLDASIDERVRRRLLDYQARGEDVSLEYVLEQVRGRDEIDSTRSIAPLRPASDAVIVDSDGMSSEETAECIIDIIEQRIDLAGER